MYYRPWGGGNGSSLGTSVGVAPQSCINFDGSYHSDTKTFEFTWEDVGCDFWGGCRLVIKKGSIAETFTDGEIVIDTFEKNKYKDTPLSVPVENGGGDYYCTLFPFSSTWVMNTMKFNTIKLMILKPFVDSTWEEIAAVSEAGNAQLAYSIGDTKQLTATDGNTYNMKIVGFNKCKLNKDSDETAGIFLMSDKLLPNTCMTYIHNIDESITTKSTPDIQLTALSDGLYNLCPDSVKSHIKNIYWELTFSAQHINYDLNLKTMMPLESIMSDTSVFPDDTSRCIPFIDDKNTWNTYYGRMGNYVYMSFGEYEFKYIVVSSGSFGSGETNLSGLYTALCFNI